MTVLPRRATAALAAFALSGPLLLGAAATPAVAHGKPATSGKHHHQQQSAKQKAAKLAAALVKATSAKDARKHLEKLQAIADANTGTRAAGTSGHEASAAYVYGLLKKAGYQVSYQDFEFTYIETLAQKLSVVTPTPADVDIIAMSFTKSTPVGGVTAPIAVVPVDDTTGCEAADYAGGTFTGRIALIKRGGCTFAAKQAAAADAGAIGAIIYNNTDGTVNGTLGDAASGRIPSGGITQAAGEALVAEAAAGEVTVAFEIRQFQEQRTTKNVIAETKGGSSANTVMLGAHLDSVTAGPGINDNGSGSAGLLDVALKLAKTNAQPANKVRFAWWSAEELGLLGSEHYVAQLTDAQRAEIKLYLNFDMIASPNYGIFVYDGDDSDGVGAGPGPEGSAQLERDITDYLDKNKVPHEGTDFTGRSDYGPFIEVGIPSGGTFTGAEVVKTAAQAAKFGGTAGEAYDSCYHQACDNIDNIDMKAFGINIGVIANAVGTYAYDISSLTTPVTTVPTNGDAGSGGGLHDGHDHEVAE